jgi:hypothetical protein
LSRGPSPVELASVAAALLSTPYLKVVIAMDPKCDPRTIALVAAADLIQKAIAMLGHK